MKKFIFVGLVAVILLAAVVGYKYSLLKNRNYCPVEIETFDGNKSPYHPSILYFNEEFAGHKFWMVETPFPPDGKPYTDRWECPSIHVSNDGYHWISPSDGGAFRNPIDDLSNDEINECDFFSDPHIFYHDGLIECWYRKTTREGDDSYFSLNATHYLFRKISQDGRVWTPRDTICVLNHMFGTEAVSPALLYNGAYNMWIVRVDNNGANSICFQTSKDAYVWSDKENCVFDVSPDAEGINPWHIDV